MTSDQIFKLIEDNKLNLHGDIEHFADLVAEKEREACARICAEVGMWDLVHEIEGRGQE